MHTLCLLKNSEAEIPTFERYGNWVRVTFFVIKKFDDYAFTHSGPDKANKKYCSSSKRQGFRGVSCYNKPVIIVETVLIDSDLSISLNRLKAWFK